jgi:hypothetical protein
MSIDCCQLALHNAQLAWRIALVAFGVITFLLAMFFGYNLTLGKRTAKLEKKNGKELKELEKVNQRLDRLEKNKGVNMTKDLLQQELLEKVKPGVKASDIKRQVKKEAKTPLSLSPIEIKDDGYESDKSNPTAPPLPNQNLLNQITSLKKQLQLYKDFREGDLKIKEDLKKEITNLKQTIEAMKNPTNPTENIQSETKTFLCSNCQQTKPHLQLSRKFGEFSFCLTCSKQARLQAQEEKTKPEEFICHACQQIKTELPNKMKLDSTLTEYLVCSTCRPTLKEFNEADLITDDLWAKYPYSSASEILEKEFNIKKEEPW